MNEPLKNNEQNASCVRMLIIAGICLLVVAVIVVGGLKFLEGQIQSSTETYKTGDDARKAISGEMGASLPGSVQNPEYHFLSMFETLAYTTVSFSLPPEDYAAFIAGAKPNEFIGKCLVLPLSPEGVQANKPDCTGGHTMNISIDKSNPALWRITIDVR